ncbi:MAG: precorrin-2 C(20)-methyltransferase [Chloroflexi bacterium]|nr:precorrin-2 C(20)-methyltransferase [Chloroflexota bacterium]
MTPKVAKVGRLYGVGVGPGDPELLTVKAQRVLSLVPVVCVPVKAAGQRSFARSIVGELIDTRRQEVLELVFPMTKDAAAAEPHWQEAAELIWKRLAAGKDCAFISEGDPLIYSTFIDIFRILVHLHPDLDIEIVPGISSFNAAAARSLTTLVDGDERLALLPATFESDKLQEVLRDFDTIVLFKVHSVLDRLLAILEEEDLTGKTVCVTRCTGAEEVIERDIRRLRGKKLDYFSLLIVRRRC